MSNNSCLGFNKTQESIIVNIRVSVACLSFIGSLTVILLICLYQKHGFYYQRLILYYGIASFLSSTAYIVGRLNYRPTSSVELDLCKAQGIWLMYTDWAVLLCNLGIGFNLMRGVLLFENSVVFEILFLMASFILPVLPACIPLYNLNSSYGSSGLWCWLQCNEQSSMNSALNLGLYIWYIPLYTLIVAMFVMYVIVLVVVRCQKRKWHSSHDPSRDVSKKELFNNALSLIGYPCVLFLINVFPFINRLHQIIKNEASFSLFVLHVIFSPLPGVLMLFIYAFDRETVRRLKWDHIKHFFKSSAVQTYSIKQASEDVN